MSCGLSLLLAGQLVGCSGVNAIDLTGASYADGLLSVGLIPKHGGSPVETSGQARLEVVAGDEVRCAAGPLYFDASNYQGPLLHLESRVACPTAGDGLRLRVRFTPEGGEEVVATGELVVTAPAASEPTTATQGEAAPARPAGPRPAGWPCSRTQRAAAATQDARFTYDYGTLRECTVPPFFGVVGCPTAEHHRLGTGTFNYDRRFRYGSDGRLVSVEQRHAGDAEPEQTFDIEYDAEGAPMQIVVHLRERPEVRWRSTREGHTVTETNGVATVTYQLDDEGRIQSSERRSSMMGVERTTWQWEGDRVTGASTANEEGGVVSTESYGYDC